VTNIIDSIDIIDSINSINIIDSNDVILLLCTTMHNMSL
jgi:hypothetical protein